MLEKVYKSKHLVRSLRGGPFGEHLDQYAGRLVEQGYANTRHKFAVIIAFDRWLETRRLSVSELSQERIDEFVAFRNRTKPSSEISFERVTLNGFLSLLREQQAIPLPPPEKKSAIDFRLEPYETYMHNECGLLPKTIQSYWYCVRIFLRGISPEKVANIETVVPKDISDFLTPFATKYCKDRTQLMITSLKSFFRFLKLKGQIERELAEYIPTIRYYRNSGIPVALDDSELVRLLGACDRKSPMGKRDFAVLKLLSLTGCRAIEVVRLTLDDIHWDNGEITIHGKCRKIEKLPLMHDVGEALADYIAHGRAKSNDRRVFLSSRAPFGRFTGSGSVSHLVKYYILKAGLNPKRKGAHLLRHTIATRALRQGATLSEISTMLRHEDIDTTAIYAKVDFPRLRTLTHSWPMEGGAK